MAKKSEKWQKNETNYEMRMKNLQLIEELLTGEIPVRYNTRSMEYLHLF